MNEKIDMLMKEKQVILFVVKPEDYMTFVESFTKEYLSNDISCYVSLGRPFQSLQNTMNRMRIPTESIFFIDTSTKSTGAAEVDADNCLFIDSPSSLTRLSIAVTKVVEASAPKTILFDSLSTLLIYNPEQMIVKFTKDLINMVRGTRSKLILIALEGKEEATLLEKTSLFVDSIQRI